MKKRIMPKKYISNAILVAKELSSQGFCSWPAVAMIFCRPARDGACYMTCDVTTLFDRHMTRHG